MKKTLIILGAGASKDVYEFFPTGFELIKAINYHLTTEMLCPPSSGKGPYLSALMNEITGVFSINIVPSVCVLKSMLWDVVLDYEWKDLRSMQKDPPTIDRVIYEKIESGELDDSAKEVARFSIAYLIKGWEQALSENISHLKKRNWIDVLFGKLKAYPFKEVLDNLTVVTFNYDRVFECFALESIRKYFGNVTEKQIKHFLNTNVCHVYGSLGSLDEVSFELKNNETGQMKRAYANCNLMDYGSKRKEWGDGACFENIYFLGFGYAEENLARLNLDGFTGSHKKGTDRGNKVIKFKLPYPIDLVDKTCTDFCAEDMSF